MGNYGIREVKTVRQMNSFSENSTDAMYTYKRKFYNQLLDFVKGDKKVCALYGPRKVGKTVALKQLEYGMASTRLVKYADFKQVTDTESLWDCVFAAIENNENIIFLFDEITYCDCIDVALAELAEKINVRELKCKFIFTGSQVIALEYWIRKYFASNASYVKVNFLLYDEFLELNNFDLTELSYRNYVLNSWKFNGIDSNREYLKSYLIETVVSNQNSYFRVKALEMIPEDLFINEIMHVVFAAILKLHNKMRWERFIDIDKALENIRTRINRTTEVKVGKEDYQLLAEQLLVKEYYLCTKIDFRYFCDIIRFLVQADFLIVTTSSEVNSMDFHKWLYTSDNSAIGVSCVTEFFRVFTLIFKQPLFYTNVLGDLCEKLQESGYAIGVEDVLNQETLGSLVECHVKSYHSCIIQDPFLKEFHSIDAQGEHEIDLVNETDLELIEISVRDKKLCDTHFSYHPKKDIYNKVLLGKSREDFENGVQRKIYYKYIYQQAERIKG